MQSDSTSFPRHHAGKEPLNQDSIKWNTTSGKLRGQLLPSRCRPGHPKTKSTNRQSLTGRGHTINYNWSWLALWSARLGKRDQVYMSQVVRKLVSLPYANNKGADQPTHARSLISAFVAHCPDSIIRKAYQGFLLLIIPNISKSKITRV